MKRWWLLLGVVLALIGCAGPRNVALKLASPIEPPHIPLPVWVRAPAPSPHTAAVAPAEPARSMHQSVVIVTIDGVRWQEVFEGVDARIAREHGMAPSEVVGPKQLVPHLYALASGEGAALGAPGHGEPIVASDSAVKSLPGYMEILSGRPSTECESNQCPRIERPTLVDQLAAQPGVDESDVAVIASWSGISRAAAEHPSRIVLSAGRSAGRNLDLLRYDATAKRLLDAGRRAGPAPGSGDYRPDRYTAAIALHYLRVEHPRFLFIGLGDTDEWGHADKYRRYLHALQDADRVVGEVVREQASLSRRGWSTVLMVTADHGRDSECRNHGGVPSAARSWLIAGGSLIGAHGFVAAPTRRHLADIAPTLRHLMGLKADSARGAGHVLEELL